MIATPPGNWRKDGASAPDPTTHQSPTVHYGDLPQDPQDAAKEARMEADEPLGTDAESAAEEAYTVRQILLMLILAIDAEQPVQFFNLFSALQAAVAECTADAAAEIEQEGA